MRPGCYISLFRCKLQLLSACFIVLSISLLLIYRRTNFNDNQPLVSANRDDITGGVIDSNRKFNLMDETSGFLKRLFNSYNECTLDYLNANKLPQDHPCVIETIKRHYLNKPSPPEVPLQLDSDDDKDRSPGQTGVIFRLLKNQTNGFFVECGALTGDAMSNTIDLERKFNWGGILIEANPEAFKKLLSRNRKSWTLPICLSLEPFPTQVTFQPKSVDPGHSHIKGAAKTLQKPGIPGIDPESVTIQCFPLYSVLLAVGRTAIDFFSLDVEGHELKILETIPWHKVNIKTLTVEWNNIPEGEEALSRFMEVNGYIRMGAFDFQWTRDVIFIKDLINA
ncbi:hypothetical protein OUZ56_019515 [Daphnia magna]|uniref:Methyltransferase FkbM domain-containing protein n=1 Tax=Daphnia magna TaxID=35525 RepID=A0ABQ9ZBS9_9CRUS|nr:hypothetical protein OUZ56_019515 [Daphnia magna]